MSYGSTEDYLLSCARMYMYVRMYVCVYMYVLLYVMLVICTAKLHMIHLLLLSSCKSFYSLYVSFVYLFFSIQLCVVLQRLRVLFFFVNHIQSLLNKWLN